MIVGDNLIMKKYKSNEEFVLANLYETEENQELKKQLEQMQYKVGK